MKIVGLDIDGVIYNWHIVVQTYCTLYKGFTGTSYEFWNGYFQTLSNDEQSYIVELPDLYDKIIPSKRILDTVNNIADISTIYYITARPDNCLTTTVKFFEKYKFPYTENIIFSKNKIHDIVANMVEYYIDDNPNTIKEVKNYTLAFWLRNYWNPTKEELPTVDSLEEFYTLIERDK